MLRHLGLIASDLVDEQAIFRLMGDEKRSGLAALEQGSDVVQAEPAFGFLLAVAGHAMALKNRPDFALEADLGAAGACDPKQSDDGSKAARHHWSIIKSRLFSSAHIRSWAASARLSPSSTRNFAASARSASVG